VALLNLTEMRSLLKWGILIQEGFLIKGKVKLMMNGKRRGGSRSAEMFYES
jgi:hypothetical protein